MGSCLSPHAKVREQVGKSSRLGEIRVIHDQLKVVVVDEFVVDDGGVSDESQREAAEADGILELSV